MKPVLLRSLSLHEREQRVLAGYLLGKLDAAERREPRSLAQVRTRKRGAGLRP